MHHDVVLLWLANATAATSFTIAEQINLDHLCPIVPE
jgi:hypothetical protein